MSNKIGKTQGLIPGLLIGVGGYFAVFLVSAIVYTTNRVLVNGIDPTLPDPNKANLKIITLVIGLVFPLLAGIYCGRVNKEIETISHLIVAVVAGIYVSYLAEGQVGTLIMSALSISAAIFVLVGFKIFYKKPQASHLG